MPALLAAHSLMSVDEFLLWEPGDGRTWQLVDGEPQAMAPPNQTHGLLQGELAGVIRNHLRASASPCRVVVTPGVVPRIQASHNVRIPDLAVRCSRPEIEEAVLADPVLLVEILSPSNQAETWGNVWAYTTIPSVQEILVLRTASIAADILRRNQDSTWPEEPERLTQGNLVLQSIGLHTDLAALYQDTRLRQA